MRGQCSAFIGVHIVHCAVGCNFIQFPFSHLCTGQAADLFQLQGNSQIGQGIVIRTGRQMNRHRPLIAQVCRWRRRAHLDAQQPVLPGQKINHLRITAQIQKRELVVVQPHRLQIGQPAHVDLCHGGIPHPQVDHGFIVPQLQPGQRPAQIGKILQFSVRCQIQLLDGIVATGKIAQLRIAAHIQRGQLICVAMQYLKRRRRGNIQRGQLIVVAE